MKPDPSFWNGRTVCVTGGTGFLGYHLVKALQGLGSRVRVFAPEPPADHPIRSLSGVQILTGDIADPKAVANAISGYSLVFHVAGIVVMTGPAVVLMERVNVQGTRNVLAAIEPGTRLVHTSSVVAIGASRRRLVLEESSPFNLQNIGLEYVRTKRQAEELVLSGSRDVVVVNPGYLIGPDDFERSVMGQLCHRFWRGRAPLAPPGGLCFVDVRDVAIGHLLAAERGRAGERYILGGENLTYQTFFQKLARAANLQPRWIPRIPLGLFYLGAVLNEWRAARAGKEAYPSRAHARLNRYFWFYSSEKARRELGYVPRSVQDSLGQTYAWYTSRETFRIRGINRWLLRPSIPKAV